MQKVIKDIFWISHESDACNWRNLPEHGQPLPGDAWFDTVHASQIATWPGQALDESCAHGICYPDKDEWNFRACPLQRGDYLRGVCKYDIGFEGDKFLRARLFLVCSSRSEADVDADISTL